ncbi:Uncharacterized protein SCF082_LOCUS10571 [Durusdinium trenchii]|uniref:Uncharacterized protein n=1 Tax=Durusdinium trenchii TaxID=1381693 RepID=A0ABP0J7G8_9DINO
MHPNRLRGYPNPIKRNPDKAQEMKKRGMGGREMKGARELLLSTWDSFQDGKHRPLVRRLPNVKLKRFDYSLTTSADGLFYLRPPYPPRINRTIECEPPGKAKKNPWPTTVHKDYKLKWKNIEYIFVPELTRKPHGTPQRRWTGPVTRVEHREGKAKVTMVTHDDEILHDCAYVQHEIDRVRAEKCLGWDRPGSVTGRREVGSPDWNRWTEGAKKDGAVQRSQHAAPGSLQFYMLPST